MLFAVLSGNAVASVGGYRAGEKAPPPHKEDAAQKGTEDTLAAKAQTIRDFRQSGYITLDGYIIREEKPGEYLFRDSSDTVRLQAPRSAFRGKVYQANDKFRVSGRVYGKANKAFLKVSRIDKP
ncbi:NirD/YgiW/YdeI family stress tolerance protein [Siccibacter turicensis]|uniref:YgiW/YdeI family stress tolerance OB fold protein n=1 Tax=Siccibacter turicensis TaxID=357233 RepID=UPI002A6A9BD2|nr:NirD/YgiW/YdeI family stress tolerance protein [Siccibacter turicensis]MDY0971417.1 NirD/YgiW/YdeI family stress tolerance protein [Siccibacter turicensis]